MVIKHVSAWAHWLIVLGILLPFFSYLGVEDYNSEQGLMWNAVNKQVEVPFSYGQNPLDCLSYGLRTRLAGPLNMKIEQNYACNLHTRIPFIDLLFVSFLAFVGGLFGFFYKQEEANVWPTDWQVHSQSSVRKPGQEINVELDREIKGKDGGF